MCKFLSSIGLKNGNIICEPSIESHELLIEQHKLNDNDSKLRNWVRLEYYPDNNKDLAQIKKYKLHIDDSVFDWITDELKAKWIRKLNVIIKKMIITTNQVYLPIGVWIVDEGVEVEKNYGNIEVMLGNSQVKEMLGNSQVNRMWGNSQVKVMWGNSQVKEMWENSQVNRMLRNSQVNRMLGNSQVNRMLGNSQVNRMWGNSQVKEMLGNSQVKEMLGNSQVKVMWGNSKVKDNRTNYKNSQRI